ncbi:type II toxin-antitoxin system ParD family antitoxin [uncultured Sulfitobacter sp.]|uniref:type II toxin-antitoxin system ParD family antitoxin n=1 Tax=uncultured Sulfitobacter sp. TaxID=191468 RepID=UPI0026185CB9|nr:type II toxin-antitoxin system ParD family antitoxin [uncultured Sulfitobacter sp.]
MATTSFSLGEHWDKFIKEQVAEGRYGSASEVVREALRHMEIERDKLAALRAHVQEGIRDADEGRFVENYDIQDVIARAKVRV